MTTLDITSYNPNKPQKCKGGGKEENVKIWVKAATIARNKETWTEQSELEFETHNFSQVAKKETLENNWHSLHNNKNFSDFKDNFLEENILISMPTPLTDNTVFCSQLSQEFGYLESKLDCWGDKYETGRRKEKGTTRKFVIHRLALRNQSHLLCPCVSLFRGWVCYEYSPLLWESAKWTSWPKVPPWPLWVSVIVLLIPGKQQWNLNWSPKSHE